MDSFFGHFLELLRSSNYNLTANFNQFNTTVLDKYWQGKYLGSKVGTPGIITVTSIPAY